MIKFRILIFNLLVSTSLAGSSWPQFRGPNASGVADAEKPPVEFSANTNLIYKLPIEAGHIAFDHRQSYFSDHLFRRFVALCLSRTLEWQNFLEAKSGSSSNRKYLQNEGSPASATVVTDGHRAIVYFGPCGSLLMT